VHCPQIGISSNQEYSHRERLWQALSLLYSVDFVAGEELDPRFLDAAILFRATRQQASDVARSGLRCLAFLEGDRAPVSSISTDISFTTASYLSQCFRGRTLADRTIDRVSSLGSEGNDEVVARKGKDILWVHSQTEAAGQDLVATAPPNLAESDYLFQHFQSENWMRLLPILHFVQEISSWERPPLRACFMFDDPNLHWRSYGYIRYRDLAQHASVNNYHVSIATIPLDSWYVSSSTADLFRQNTTRLSLLIHGNNHTYFELSQGLTAADRELLAAQALCRIERLEKISGLEVARVMAAPHGACNYDMAAMLLRTGFEAACISRSSLMGRNPNFVWPISVGLNPAEFFGSGLPIIPRFHIRWDSTYVLFAAFLGQPIIPMGHHEDVGDNLELLQRMADLINSMGEVHWVDMKSMARTNVSTCRSGDTLHIKMYSRKIRLTIPEGVKSVQIHRPWLDENGEEKLILLTDEQAPEIVRSDRISVTPGEETLIVSSYPDMIEPRNVQIWRAPLWAVARRNLCEGRDRLRPAVNRLLAFKNARR
jgi:hypothetical protein